MPRLHPITINTYTASSIYPRYERQLMGLRGAKMGVGQGSRVGKGQAGQLGLFVREGDSSRSRAKIVWPYFMYRRGGGGGSVIWRDALTRQHAAFSLEGMYVNIRLPL